MRVKLNRKSLTILCVLSAVVLSGCASSDRMLRMSGGVLGEYSAPESFRLQSDSYGSHSSSRFVDTPKIAGMNDTLINIWPFFFRNNEYCSALWPIYDRDKYGFAVRPFYNQEGDDRSVLFPLSAWNSEEGNGWVLNWVWNNDSLGLVPLFWYKDGSSRSWLYIFPFTCIERVSSGSSALVGPVYFKKDERYNQKKLGLFPLLHFGKETDKFNFAALCWLSAIKRNSFRNEFSWHILGPLLARYRSGGRPNGKEYGSPEERAEKPREYSEYRNFTALCWLLNRSKTSRHYLLNKEEKKELRLLGERFPESMEQLSAKLREIDSKLELPDAVKDSRSCLEFINGLDESVSRSYSFRLFPLFMYRGNVENRYFRWIAPLFLSWYERDEDDSTFRCLPLLSYAGGDKSSKSSYVLTPLVYSSKSESYSAKTHDVVSEGTSWPGDSSKICDIRTRLFIWAYRHEKEGYNVARKNADEVDFIRTELPRFMHARKKLDYRREGIEREEKRIENMTGDSKLLYYRKMVAIEENKQARESLEEDEKSFEKSVRSLMEKASVIGFKLDKEAFCNEDENSAALDRLMAEHTEMQYLESWGNGLIFKKEKSWTGDYRWRMLLGLAAGSKDGAKENAHVFHLLYSYRKDGDRSEKIFFPFCSDVRDGENSRFSFMGRVFQKTVEDGRTSGYFMFIPFGEE